MARTAFPLAIQGDGLVILLVVASLHGFVICVGAALSQIGWRGKRCEGHRGFCAVMFMLTGMLVGVHTMVWTWYESRKNCRSSGGGKPRTHWGGVSTSSFGRERVDRMSDRVHFPKATGGPWYSSAMGSAHHNDSVPLLRNLCGSSVLGDQILAYVSEHVSRELFRGVVFGVRDRVILGDPRSSIVPSGCSFGACSCDRSSIGHGTPQVTSVAVFPSFTLRRIYTFIVRRVWCVRSWRISLSMLCLSRFTASPSGWRCDPA